MLKVGFVGLGAISHENVLGYVGSPDATVTAVCSRSKEKADSGRGGAEARSRGQGDGH